MSSFVQLFGFDEDGEPPEEHVQPAWLGPPEDELGVATPLTVVLGRSERGAVALVMATSYTTGLTLSFVAQARDLDRRAAHALFHEQHPYGSGEEDLPDGFLRPTRCRAAWGREGLKYRWPAPLRKRRSGRAGLHPPQWRQRKQWPRPCDDEPRILGLAVAGAGNDPGLLRVATRRDRALDRRDRRSRSRGGCKTRAPALAGLT